jgi:hypothetical protein
MKPFNYLRRALRGPVLYIAYMSLLLFFFVAICSNALSLAMHGIIWLTSGITINRLMPTNTQLSMIIFYTITFICTITLILLINCLVLLVDLKAKTHKTNDLWWYKFKRLPFGRQLYYFILKYMQK